jgi:uncharacterized protein (TIGR02453 family)
MAGLKVPYFDADLFAFQRALTRNNNRDWFHANKDRFERVLRVPARRLIADLATPLADVSPHFVANPAKVGGSLFRIQRDTRFSGDKHPYKTWLGIRLYHERRRDVHAPSFYLHLQPGECFVAGGLWRPEPPVLKRVREFIVDNPEAWARAARSSTFLRDFVLGGESLTRPPRCYPPDHPLIDDLKRKDFIAWQNFDEAEAFKPGFDRFVIARVKRLAPLVDYMCAALDLDF